ncbi:MAG: cytochrome c oxidase assembly protein [Armatimonadetes bacterium]|nr:cytochrome c oxidase assembly protein [Armatimonadota bacterium]
MSWRWNTSPSLIGMLLVVAVLYRLCVVLARKRLAPPETPFPAREALWFDGALVLFYLAVGSPLDEMSERFLFSAHMIQHTLLIFILPIMLLKGIPAWMLQPLVDNRWLRYFTRVLGHPLSALLGFNLLFALWHIPGLYEWALRDRRVHELEHVTFVLGGVWMWWPIFCPRPEFRLGYGLQMLYAFALSVTQIPMFAFLVFTPSVLYPTYNGAPRLVQILPPIEDQVMGGIIMKVVGEAFFLGIIIVALMEWYRRDKYVPPPKRAPVPAPD